MTREYKQILPMEVDKTVALQFGALPLSVMDFENDDGTYRHYNYDHWSSIAYLEPLQEEFRRNNDNEYLPGYGLSEFSSAVCEFIVRYWTMRNSVIIDPFAGRATRAVISTKLKRNYIGYEISPKTYTRSQEHFAKLGIDPVLYLGDGCMLDQTGDEKAHACITCPPYGDLEKYESVPGQLSDVKTYSEFLHHLTVCVKNVHRVLKPGGFSCWVVADWRDADGYHPFAIDTFNIFRDCGFKPHDIVILKNRSPFAALQAAKCASKRITSKIHEMLLVFRKDGELDLDGLVQDEVNEKANEFFQF